MAGFGVDPQALKLAEEGINGAIAELQGLGIAGLAESGRGFSELELTGMEAGHPDLHTVFTAFCERWSWGVRALVQEGSDLALKLRPRRRRRRRPPPSSPSCRHRRT
ncbi:hypothetical protein ACFVFS_27250 [Kitasatospora sp. NPDC057692]|uniref:hypothetical protein n=1 Tax=Kitasatospora sp. NPDC057692 TaxID=3346215 RepID=UPI00368134B0